MARFDFSEKPEGLANISPAKYDATRSAPVYQWIGSEATRLGAGVDAVGNLKFGRRTFVDLRNELIVRNSLRCGDDKPFAPGVMDAALELWISDKAAARLSEIRMMLAKHETDDAASVRARLVEMMTLASPDDAQFNPDECARLVEKFIWQVKRKLHDLPVTQHTMLVLVGPQGGGKSELLDRLLAPVAELRVNTAMNAITDDRNIQLFEAYVGVADELDKADKADIETLKRVITETWMSRRPMRTGKLIRIRQNLTLIGTSNKDVAESIVDETGNRRFVQIDVVGPQHASSKAFWTAANAFDWAALWRCVDETAADPSAEIAARIRQVQAASRTESDVELWLQHVAEHNNAIMNTGHYSSIDMLFQSFCEWCTIYGPAWKCSMQMFSKRLSRLARQGVIPMKAHRAANSRGYICTAEDRNPLV